MKIRTLLTAILGLFVTTSLSLSQEAASPEPMLEETLSAEPSSPEPASQEPLLAEASSPEPLQQESPSRSPSPAKPLPGRRSSRARSSSGETVTRILTLKYFPTEEMRLLTVDIFGIHPEKVHSDRRANRLILQATKAQMDNVMSLIQELDVPAPDLKRGHAVDNLVYRVYMFEIPSGDQDLKPFSMILQTPAQLSSTILLDIAMAQKIHVSDFLIIDERDSENDILIQGKAPSNESIKRMVKEISDSQIRELRWDDDETFTRNIEAAHYSRLPTQMQKHIQKFLGENIVTVGYWFGSSSVPGEVEAPIGPWTFQLELSLESDRTLELRVEVEALKERSDFDRQLGRERSDEILSNHILVKVGKPIIIGYNRQSCGTRKMGAMVILPQVDVIESEGK